MGGLAVGGHPDRAWMSRDPSRSEACPRGQELTARWGLDLEMESRPQEAGENGPFLLP